MAAISNYPASGVVVRGEPLTIAVDIKVNGVPQDISTWVWRSHIRKGPDRPLLMEFAISTDTPPDSDVESRLFLDLTAEQMTVLKDGVGFDVEQMAPVQRTWWICPKLTITKDYSHE